MNVGSGLWAVGFVCLFLFVLRRSQWEGGGSSEGGGVGWGGVGGGDKWKDGWTDGRTDGRTDGWVFVSRGRLSFYPTFYVSRGEAIVYLLSFVASQAGKTPPPPLEQPPPPLRACVEAA